MATKSEFLRCVLAAGVVLAACESTADAEGDAGLGGSATGGGGEATGGLSGDGGTAVGGGAGGEGEAGGEAVICAPVLPTSAPDDGPPFAAPQAVLFVGDLLVVASTGAAWNPDVMSVEFGEGFLQVIDPRTGAFVNRIPTSHPNPQRLVVHGDQLFVVNTGTTVYDQMAFEVHVTGPGAIDTIAVANLRTATGAEKTAELAFDAAMPLLGAPIDLAFVGDRGFLTSGTGNTLFVLDAAALTLSRGTANPIQLAGAPGVGLGSLVAHGDHLYVTDFNSDTLYRVKGADGSVAPCGIELGVAADLEGATSPRVVGDDLLVMLAISGSLERRALADLDAAFDADCPDVDAAQTIAPLGQYPNDVMVFGGSFYVVNSGDNQVVEYTAAGDETRRFDLSVGANPWAAAMSASGRYLAVTEQSGNGVTIFDLSCDAQSYRLGGAL